MIKISKSIYIHIPFCRQICNYCDFNKFLIDNQPVGQYLDALGKEFKLVGAKEAKTIFIGGGTPSALTVNQLEKLMNLIRKYFKFDKDTEFTVEANPDDVTADKLSVLYQAGVNRLSLGVQTFQEGLLAKIGRSHSQADVHNAVEIARRAGFENINIDLIYALPGQSLVQVKDDLQKAISLDLAHISAYSLIIEPKTVFYQLVNQGEMTESSEDDEAEMYELVMETLDVNGFKQYEISNFAKPGRQCKHNQTYWQNEEYYGFGLGAHGYINRERYANHHVLKKYFTAISGGQRPILTKKIILPLEMMEEEMFLGLRQTEGIDIPQFQESFGRPVFQVFPLVIEDFVRKGLLTVADQRVKLTQKGKLLGNEVFQAFLK